VSVETIEGQTTLVVKRRPPLQPKLDQLLHALIQVTYRADLMPGGARVECERRQHRFKRFREGRHVGLDGVVRDLRLEMCADCGAVCVRDISLDTLSALSGDARDARLTARSGPRRRDHILGWYSGARRNQRTYT
jgi:hypothetical protein